MTRVSWWLTPSFKNMPVYKPFEVNVGSGRSLWSYRLSVCENFKRNLHLAVELILWHFRQSRTTNWRIPWCILLEHSYLNAINYTQKWVVQLKKGIQGWHKMNRRGKSTISVSIFQAQRERRFLNVIGRTLASRNREDFFFQWLCKIKD
jgi:hypothetical protein